MHRVRGAFAFSLLLACGASKGGDTDTTTGGESTTGPTTGAPTTGGELIPGCDVVLRGDTDDAAAIQAALDAATDDTTICLVGRFVSGPLQTSGKAGLTLRGVADEAGSLAALDFQGAAEPAGLAFSDMTDLAVETLQLLDPGGHGLEVSNSTGVAMRGLEVRWQGGPSVENGLFGLRAVDSTSVLVEDSLVSGASDAGIFTLDSRDVVFRRNTATGNVTGLQVENTERAEIHDNVSHDNALGIFVVDLPTTPAGIGEVLVRDNDVHDNNGVNFAAPDALVAAIPSGIGVMVLATDTVEIRGNTIEDNDSTGVIVVSFETVALLSSPSGEPDPGYDAYPETADIHDNTLQGNGTMPADLFVTVFQLPTMPDLAWDGAVDSAKDNGDGRLDLCIRNNGDADFINLDALNLGADKSTDLAPHDCSHPPVAGVDNIPM